MRLIVPLIIFALFVFACAGPESIRPGESGQQGTWKGTFIESKIDDLEGRTRSIAAFQMANKPDRIRFPTRELTPEEIDLVFSYPLPLCRFENGKHGIHAFAVIPVSEFDVFDKAIKVRGSLRTEYITQPVRLSADHDEVVIFKRTNQNPRWASGPFVLLLNDKELRKLGWKGPIAKSWDEPAAKPSE